MSYIEKLRSLNEAEREKEVKTLIFEFSQKLIDDKARLKIVSGDLEGCWDEVDEVCVDAILIDSEKMECRANIEWQSYGPHDEDDERVLYGCATACIADDRSVVFIDTEAKFDGSPPQRKEGTAADEWWAGLDENDRAGWTDDMNKE